MKQDKGTSTNNNGLGSTYAGTQSPDNKAPDAYQQPTGKDADKKNTKHQEDLGREYDSTSSYGDKGSKPDHKGVEKGESNSEEGSPVR